MKHGWHVTAVAVATLAIAAIAQAQEPASADPLPELSEETGSETGTRPLSIYGFIDFSYLRPLWSPPSPWSQVLGQYDGFSVGSINVYFAKDISEGCTSLLELRFLYVPNGNVDPNTRNRRVRGTADDPADVERPLKWGGIEVERVHAECQLHPLLGVRFGQWLTPYGIWNQDHGTPTIIGIRRPYVIGKALLPERQTGLMLFGGYALGDLDLGYNLTLSNGRGPLDAYRDLDRNKALGGRLEARWRRWGDLTAGISHYRGRMTDSEPVIYNAAERASSAEIAQQYDEEATGLDLRWDFRKVVLRAEVIRAARAFTDQGRGFANAEKTTYLIDSTQYGGYVLLGYRTPFFGVMPFVIAEQFEPGKDPNREFAKQVYLFHGGLNVQVNPALVIKAEYIRGWFPDAVEVLKNNTFHAFELQVAWVF